MPRTKNTIYSIETVPGTVVNVLGAPVGIDSIELPPGFDRREIVVRQANQQLDVRGTQLWSASLQPLVLHTLAFDLAGRLPAGMVILPGQSKPAAMRSIDVVFEQIAAGPGNNITLDARWTLAGAAHREQITVPIDSLDSAMIAEGMGRAIGELSDRMAIAAGRSPAPQAQR
jgi:uncharacterized lipoprotein YmbA